MPYRSIGMIKQFVLNGKIFSNEGGSLIAVLVIAVLAAMILQSLAFSTRSTLKSSGRHVSKVSVLNIAEAGKERVIARLRERTLNFTANQNTTVYSNEPFGAGHYTVRCSTSTALDTVTIYSIGTQGVDTIKLRVVAYIQPDVNVNAGIQAAVTARTKVETLGNMVIDGRDYDSTGVLLGTGGVYGIAAGGTVSVGGASTVGGNSTAPQKSALPGVTVQVNIDTNGYPQTPEEVLGLAPGALKDYTISSCPAQVSGLTYCETADNLESGSGILILHNSSGTASFENYHANFKGLIIADEVKHVNAGASVLGAVFLLGKNVGGNCFGNGNSTIHYSSQVIADVLSDALNSGRRTVDIVSWREVN
jgi:hypothetical protein